ncbi:MAG TPA: ATP-binding protein [Acidimicrobiales bacterium]|nr:ATP-binding protein [Acidimicrobiales bacterium]
MAGEQGFDVAAFAAAYVELAGAVERAAPQQVGPFARLLGEHFETDTTDLPVVSMGVEVFDQPNLQRALDALASQDDVEVVRLVGLRGEARLYGNLSLAMLTQGNLRIEVGPVDHVERLVDTHRTLTCIDFGLVLLRLGETPIALLVRSADERHGRATLSVEVMGHDREAGPELLGRIRALMAAHNVFREKVVSLSPAGMFDRSLEARFAERPRLERSDVILPDGVLERIERMTVEFSARAASLRAGRRHLRRGLLLHGPPGTGKTHTVRYLLSRLPDRTVFLLSGQGLVAIAKTVALARALQPAIVVLEDVDLVAEERTRPHSGTNPVLFELLNQMDGVEEDADIVFILTTNRPDLLEPALASRPGRVDLAVELPLPAAAERFRLLQLYARGLRVDGVDWAPVVERTDGTSAAFLRELLRQAALNGATDDDDVPVLDNAGLLKVLADLGTASQAVTLRLLGSSHT